MVLNEPTGNPLLSPAGAEAASAVTEEVLAEGDEVVVEDKAAAVTGVMVLEDVDDEVFVVVLLVEGLG